MTGTTEITEWDKACRAVKKLIGFDVLLPELQKMKTEGDAIQETLKAVKAWTVKNSHERIVWKNWNELLELLGEEN